MEKEQGPKFDEIDEIDEHDDHNDEEDQEEDRQELKTEPKPEKPETTIEEVDEKKTKKSLPSIVVFGGLIILILFIGGLVFIGNRGGNSEPAHKPSAADIAQQKIDADREGREQRQIDGLRDDDFFIRDERVQPSASQLFRGLTTEAPKTNFSWEDEQAEEEAINYILHGTQAKARAQQEAEVSVAQTSAAAPIQQNNATTTARPAENNNNQSMPSPMFVYSRHFGGARYTESKPGQQIRQTDHAGETGVNQAFPFSEAELMRLALGLTSPPAAATNIEEPVFDIPAMATTDKPTQLIYTAHPPVVVSEGEFLEAALVNRLIVNVEPSPVVTILSRDVFDRSRRYVVFPANSRVIGTAHAVNYRGASRLYISFHRIILPNGLSVDLPQSNRFLRAMDETGAIGIVSHVNRHWMMQFGAAVMLGVFDGIAGYAQRNNQMTTMDGMVIGRTSENFGRILDRLMDRYSSIMPTISVFQGKTMRIYITDDMVVSPYSLITERSYYGNR